MGEKRTAAEVAEERGRVWTVSNGLSFLRLLLAVPTVAAMVSGEKTLAIVLFFTAAATDYLDGYVARLRNEISEFGRIIDPIADKAYVAAAVVAMLLLDIVPLWLLVVVLARDLLILIGGILVQRRTGEVLASNWTGKWTVGVLSITLLLYYLEVDGPILAFFIGLTLVMLLLSLILYARTALQHLATSGQGENR